MFILYVTIVVLMIFWIVLCLRAAGWMKRHNKPLSSGPWYVRWFW